MTSQIAIKAYRLSQLPANAKITDQGDQIKRFQLAYGQIGDESSEVFSRLRNEVCTLYGLSPLNSGEKAFRLYWKDDENELIEMSTDADFHTAVQCQTTGLVKVYIVDLANKSQTNEPEDFEFETVDMCVDDDAIKEAKKSQTHRGLKCDACQNKILGLRYKCVRCFEFNLCEDCRLKKNG